MGEPGGSYWRAGKTDLARVVMVMTERHYVLKKLLGNKMFRSWHERVGMWWDEDDPVSSCPNCLEGVCFLEVGRTPGGLGWEEAAGLLRGRSLQLQEWSVPSQWPFPEVGFAVFTDYTDGSSWDSKWYQGRNKHWIGWLHVCFCSLKSCLLCVKSWPFHCGTLWALFSLSLS